MGHDTTDHLEDQSHLPHKHDGIVYVIEFSDSTIKVGKTRNWISRLRTHTSDASRFGLTVKRSACSGVHRNYHASERELIALAGVTALKSVRKEYFLGASFEMLSEYVHQLKAKPSTAEEIAADAERERAATERVLAWAKETYPPKLVVEVEDKYAQWVFSLLLTPGAKWCANNRDSEGTRILIDALVTAEGIERDEAESMTTLEVLQRLAETHIKIGIYRLLANADSTMRTELETPLGELER